MAGLARGASGAAPSRGRVLFLCTGNSARSQIAESLVHHHLEAQWEAHSAGSAPAGYVQSAGAGGADGGRRQAVRPALQVRGGVSGPELRSGRDSLRRCGGMPSLVRRRSPGAHELSRSGGGAGDPRRPAASVPTRARRHWTRGARPLAYPGGFRPALTQPWSSVDPGITSVRYDKQCKDARSIAVPSRPRAAPHGPAAFQGISLGGPTQARRASPRTDPRATTVRPLCRTRWSLAFGAASLGGG